MSYDPATVRAMLRQAYRRGHDDADEPAWNMHHNRCAEAGEAAINSILAAHPAPVAAPKVLCDPADNCPECAAGDDPSDVLREAAFGGGTTEIDHGPTAVRIYRTSSHNDGAWALQVRTRFMRADGQPGAKSIAAIANLSADDMRALRGAIDLMLAEQESRHGR